MDGKTPIVSVIMSVHNGERWLRQAIESIVHQDMAAWELLICDDASGAPAQAILKEFSDPRIRIYHNKERKGLTANLNSLIQQCGGRYIARMDADDISLPHRLRIQSDFLDRNKQTDMVAGWIEFIDENGNITGSWQDDRKYTESSSIAGIIGKKNVIAHPTIMIRADVLRVFGYNEKQQHSQDWDLWMRMTAAGKKIEKIAEVLLQYRVHPTSVTAAAKAGSVTRKINTVYSTYLASLNEGERKTSFNRMVKKYADLNRLKMMASRIKNIFRS